MAIYHSPLKSDFTIMPNSSIRDNRLSLKDIGLLTFMLSLPADWCFSVKGLAAFVPNDGNDAITASLKRLEKAGYLRRVVLREKGKITGTLWSVFDIPIADHETVADRYVVRGTNPRNDSISYQEYMSSDVWAATRKRRMIIDHFQCQICGTAKNLSVHHITYERLGHEDMEDLLTVCKKCHEEIHKHDLEKRKGDKTNDNT